MSCDYVYPWKAEQIFEFFKSSNKNRYLLDTTSYLSLKQQKNLSSVLNERCTRGLEVYISRFVFGLESNTRDVVQQVLSLQSYQRKTRGSSEPTSIRMLYSRLSKEHCYRAAQQGIIDSQE